MGDLFIILHSRFEWRFILALRVIGIITIIIIFGLSDVFGILEEVITRLEYLLDVMCLV